MMSSDRSQGKKKWWKSESSVDVYVTLHQIFQIFIVTTLTFLLAYNQLKLRIVQRESAMLHHRTVAQNRQIHVFSRHCKRRGAFSWLRFAAALLDVTKSYPLGL